MDATSSSFIGDFAGKFGFPALLVLVLLYGIYKMLDNSKQEREKRDERDDTREAARRAERDALMQGHLGALEKHGQRIEAQTSAINGLGQAVTAQGQKLDRLLDAQRESELRLVKGG